MVALALANTAVPEDVLTTPAGLASWLAANEDHLGPSAPEVALRLGDFRGLRSAVRDAVAAGVAGAPPPAEAIRVLNDASAAVPSAPALDLSDGRPRRVERPAATPSQTVWILATIASSAIDLLGGSNRERLRICAARRCGRVFVASRSRRVWCSAACGNRTRVARHHARRGR